MPLNSSKPSPSESEAEGEEEGVVDSLLFPEWIPGINAPTRFAAFFEATFPLLANCLPLLFFLSPPSDKDSEKTPEEPEVEGL